MKARTTRNGMGKSEGFLTDAVKFVKKEVRGVEKGLEEKATQIATYSTIFGISIGVVIGIVGTVLMQKYVTGPQASQQAPGTPPQA